MSVESNREALRRLSRKFPAPPEITRIMTDLKKGSDLQIAIVATAIVEAHLEKLMVKKFTHASKGLVGQLFLNRGPLMDFHSKILVATAFGVITPNMADELHSIKAIRNTFAHAKVPITFSNELVERETKSFKMFSAIQNAQEDAGPKMELENKAWFLLIIEILLIMMDSIGERPWPAHAAIEHNLKVEPT